LKFVAYSLQLVACSLPLAACSHRTGRHPETL
jgi:hypothetical protein